MSMHNWSQVSAGTWHNFHVLWTARITNCLNDSLLPTGYFAMAEQVVGGPEPDVVSLKLNEPDPFDQQGGGLAVTQAPPRPETTFVIPAESDRYAARANRISVRHELDTVVAVIELISPGNKNSKHAMRQLIDKTVELIFQGINVMVVDVFPPGPRDPQGIHKLIWDELADQEFALPADRPLTLASYQASPVKTAFVEPFCVGSDLPDMPLFLFQEHYILLPLERTYAETWQALPDPIRRLLV